MAHTSLMFVPTGRFCPGDVILLKLLISLALPLLSLGKGLQALQRSKTESQSSWGSSGAQSLVQFLLPENPAQPPSPGQQRCHSHTLLQGLEGFGGNMSKFLRAGGDLLSRGTCPRSLESVIQVKEPKSLVSPCSKAAC